jgi:transcriptional regulator with XRE-family HTH domain
MFENLGITLRLLRELRGQSQAAVARQAGLGKSQLSKYETGRDQPKMESLERLLTALGVSFLDLALTLALINSRRESLGSEGPEAVLLTSRSLLLDSPVHEAFERLQTDLLRLHREVLQSLVRSPRRKTSGEG